MPISDEEAILLRDRDTAFGGCEEWWAITGMLYDTPEGAQEYADEVEANMVANARLPTKWEIFELDGD